MAAFIKPFSTCTGKYFYDVGKNQIIKVTEEEYRNIFLYKNMDDNLFFDRNSMNKETVDHIKKYTDKGYLSNKKAKRIIHPYTYIAEDILSNKLHMAILQVTQMCNLKCRYCPYSGNGYLDRKHINKSMDFEIAKKAIDFVISNGLFSDEYNFGFYGGEPLISLNLIKKIVTYAKKRALGKNLSFFITTNGTLLSKTTIDYLAKNNFSVTFSLDGPAVIHDKNRKVATTGAGSFESAYNALRIIANEYPEFVSRIGINAVWDMEESYSTIMNFFATDPILKHFEYAITTVDNTIIDMNFSMAAFNYHEQQLAQMYSMLDSIGLIEGNSSRDKSTFKPIDDFAKALIPRMEIPDECHFGGMCLPGYNRLFIDVDGNFFPCEKVSANSSIAKIGDVFEGFDYKKIKKIMNVGALTASECKECWCGHFCTCCFKFVDDLQTMSRDKKLNECKQIKKSVLKNMKEYVIYKEAEKMHHSYIKSKGE